MSELVTGKLPTLCILCRFGPDQLISSPPDGPGVPVSSLILVSLFHKNNQRQHEVQSIPLIFHLLILAAICFLLFGLLYTIVSTIRRLRFIVGYFHLVVFQPVCFWSPWMCFPWFVGGESSPSHNLGKQTS